MTMNDQKKLYQVQGGHSVRAAGKSHRGGTADDIVALAMVDAKRLMDAGVILPVDGKGKGNAPAPAPAPAPANVVQNIVQLPPVTSVVTDQATNPATDPAAGNGTGEGAIDTWADGILAGNVGEVAEAIKGLDADALQALSEAESGREKPRKGVLEAIEAELASGQE